MSLLHSRCSLSLLCALGVLGGITTGCNRSGAHRSFTTIGPPAMPQVSATPSYDSRTKSESEVVAAALQLARAGDHAGAAAEIATPRDPFDRARMAGHVATTLAARDPGLAAAFARALPWGGAQAAAIDAAAQAYAAREEEPAIDWALTWTDVHSGRVARHGVARALVARDARDAIERITRRPAGAARDDLLVAAAGAWARRDAPATLTWLRAWPEDELKPRLTSGIGFEIAQTQPARAVDVADLMPAGRNRWLLLSAIAQTWVAIDAKEALAWAGQLPAGAAREAALAGAETGFGVPLSRRGVAAPGTRGGSSRTRGGAGAIVTSSATDSPAFAAWMSTQPSGLSPDEAILEYVRQRGALEPQSVGAWLSAMPGGTTRDRAMEIYVENALPTAPAEVARWLRHLPRSERSERMIEQTARRWLQTSPDAAEAWLQDLPLPGYLKDRLLRDAGR
jgi:hypothetical protein